MTDIEYMNLALKEAQKAFDLDEVPVGCVIVKDGIVIAKGHNLKEKEHLATSHAEINAIKAASKKIGDWRLNECTMYVTLEPCLMCCGALIQARIKKVIFGAYDPKGGGVVSLTHTFDIQFLNHIVQWESGLMETECLQLLKEYFKTKREK